jgi:hypothetical protein
MMNALIPATPAFSEDSFEQEFADWIRQMRDAGFVFKLQDWTCETRSWSSNHMAIQMRLVAFRP